MSNRLEQNLPMRLCHWLKLITLLAMVYSLCVVCFGQSLPADEVDLNDYFIKSDSLRYSGYEVVRLRTPINHGFREVTSAAIKKQGTVLREFNSVEPGLPNATEVGLFSFLGKGKKQLAISQTMPRGGRHWIVDLSSGVRVLFDSGDYEVGRENFGATDLDKDGVYEIAFPVTAFYSVFDQLAVSQTPLPLLIFRYNPILRKYQPANHLYKKRFLLGIRTAINGLAGKSEKDNLGEYLSILLRYLYVGEAQTGWEFFERHCREPDKTQIKNTINEVLSRAPAYRFIQQRSTTRNS